MYNHLNSDREEREIIIQQIQQEHFHRSIVKMEPESKVQFLRILQLKTRIYWDSQHTKREVGSLQDIQSTYQLRRYLNGLKRVKQTP